MVYYYMIFLYVYSLFVLQIEALCMNEGGFQNECKGIFFEEYHTGNGVRTL